MKKIPISSLKELMKFRNTLDAVSQISWSFSLLNKQNPINELTEEDAQELIDSYKDFIEELRTIINK